MRREIGVAGMAVKLVAMALALAGARDTLSASRSGGAPRPAASSGPALAPALASRSASAVAPAPSRAAAGPNAEALDYLIQDVCVNAAQAPVAGDPATCRTHRNLRVGEQLPYIVTDFDRARNISLGSTSSVPVRSTAGRTMVLVSKSLQGNYAPDTRLTYTRERDAFDLIDVSSSRYASIVRTFDGGCADQLLSRNGKTDSLANRAGGWILFPLSPPPSQWAGPGSVKLTTWRVQLSRKGPECATNHGAGITFWTPPTPYTFETGKTLRAVRSDHFAAADIRAAENSFERFFFTREYGMTRWEAWWTLAHCQSALGPGAARCDAGHGNPLRARCNVLKTAAAGAPGSETWGGQRWVMMDCRDSTRYVALRQPQLTRSLDMGRGEGRIDVAQ